VLLRSLWQLGLGKDSISGTSRELRSKELVDFFFFFLE
jgi:hypothetical protein